jgi:hypothetical protein
MKFAAAARPADAAVLSCEQFMPVIPGDQPW